MTIQRSGQLESIRMMDEDEWPDPSDLADYNPIYEPDPNFYYPNDYFYELGMFLRDHTIRKRKERAEAKREAERNNRNR
jgi:hypothetical protein